MFLALLLLGLVLLRGGVGDQLEMSLNGDSWSLSDTDGRVKAIKAQVPGSVHLDLMHNGIIEDPYKSWNDWLYQWIAYSNWNYSRFFNITSDQIEGKTVWLKCDGLDTVANVSINSKQVGTANNMHRQYFFDITDVIKTGQNLISVDFESASNYSNRTAARYPYYIGSFSQYFNFSSRNFVRKVASDFGWDWGPAFLPIGIWQNISIVTFTEAYVSYVTPKTHYDPLTKTYSVTVTVCLIIPKPTTIDVAVVTELADIGVPPIQKKISVTTLENNTSECHSIVGDPIAASVIEEKYLWWPVRIKLPSSPPALVRTNTQVTITKNEKKISTVNVTKNVGFRCIRLIQDPVGKKGSTFYFQMSTSTGDYPIFIKGSNWVPMDAFVTRATPEYARSLLESAVAAHQNMIRICGVAYYHPDWFYDICDELGIMVWQEFMFCDALYPRDCEFLATVEEEVRQAVRRLAHHPSIVMWIGNNENQDLALRWGTDAIVDYSVLYDNTIRATLWEEDNTRPYWPAGPSNGFLVDDRERGLFIQKWGEQSDPNSGDIHRYDYTSYCTDVSKFPKPRFASEFGFQSYPSFRSWKNISTIDDWSNDSPLMLHRQHHPNGNQQMEAMMAMFFHMPNNTKREDQFKDFIYLSQVIQAICVNTEAQFYRRMLSTEDVLTRGTMYWQLNDIWQTQSWSSLEWSGQWKLLHYYIRRTYNHTHVSPLYVDGKISIYVVVDVINYDITYDLQVEVITWASGKTVNTFSKSNLKSTGFTGLEVFNEKMEDVFKGTTAKESFLYIKITDPIRNNTLLAENLFFPSNFTDIDLPEANVTATYFDLTPLNIIKFTLTTDAVAPYVYLASPAYDGIFSDNGFLAMPQKNYYITFTPIPDIAMMNLDTFQRTLTIRTIRDTYKNKPY